MHRFQRLLVRSVLTVVSHPRWTLAIAAAALIACVALAWTRLSISTNQDELFSPTAPHFRAYLRFVEEFPENEAIYVLIEPSGPAMPSTDRWTQATDAVAERLSALSDHVRWVDWKVPLDRLGSQGLLFENPAKLPEVWNEARSFLPLVKLWGEAPSWPMRLMGASPIQRFVSGLLTQRPDRQTADFLKILVESWTVSLGRGHVVVLDLSRLDADTPSRRGYYQTADASSPDRSLLMVRVYPQRDFTSLTAISATVDAIRAAVAEALAPYPELRGGVTGRPALEADEMRTTDADTRRAEIVALTAVFIGLVVLLRSIWLALVAELSLGVGIGWTFGWATLSVGELNLLSIVFLLALIGIGMDSLIQILSRYRQERARRHRPLNIWAAVFHQVGTPVTTASAGAAAAFLVSIFSDFRGAAQLGIIAGGGLLLCLLAGYTVMPAILTLWPGKASVPTPIRWRTEALQHRRRGWRYAIGPAIWGGLMLAGIPFALRTGFNPNLIALQAEDQDSVQLVKKLQTWSAAVLSEDLASLRRAEAALRGAPGVSSTDSIADAYDNREWLSARATDFADIGWTVPDPLGAGAVVPLGDQLGALSKRFADFPQTAATLDQARSALLSVGANEAAATLSGWQEAFVAELRRTIAQFTPPPLDEAAVPNELLSHYKSPGGIYALYVYPMEDLWNHAALTRFVQTVESRVAAAAPNTVVTGIAPNIYHSTAAIERSFYQGTLIALGMIFLLVLLDVRKLYQTFLAISVLALGLPMLVALMGLFSVDWNFANFFGLPILIGAAHEYGVFMVHRYREVLHDHRRHWLGWDVADRALTLCWFTTSTSFGFFWLMAHHRGLQSLGMIMAAGAACIYLATVLVLRPLLMWRLEVLRERRAAAAGPTSPMPS